jgi:hypothetical protein
MAKSIHERVRASLAKAARDEQAKLDRAHDVLMSRLERQDIKREARIDALINGTAEPRNLEELMIVHRAEFGDDL